MLKMIKNKKLRIFIIILFILIILGTIIYFVVSGLKSSYRKFYKTSDELVLEQTYNTIFNEIDIETKMTDIYIKESDDNKIKVMVYGEEDYIKFSEKNNKLFVDINEKNFIAFDFYSCISRVEIYLPKGYEKLIRIDSEFGNIELDEFINLTLYVDQEYGNILSNGVDFIKLENNNGNVELIKATKARVYATSGNVKIGKVEDLIIENEYGNIEVEEVNKYLKLSNESGNIKINDLHIEKDSSIDAEYSDIEIGTTNEIYINAKSEHGKVKISNNYKGSEVVLKIHNESGDININN